jgi:acetyltransferase-like isoleucine patch superfamily enzyme
MILIHYSARYLPFEVSISLGLTCFSNVTIESNVKTGKGELNNIAVFVTHDFQISDFPFVGHGVILIEGLTIGRNFMLGTRAIFLPNVSLADNVYDGADAVVTKNIANSLVVIGIPAVPQ